MTFDGSSIRVEAPARLHLGFLDPDGCSGRRYGSIGLAIDTLATVVCAEPAAALEVSGAEVERARALVDRVFAHYDLPRALAIRVESAIPIHAGLGSGTQLALAIGTAVTRACGLAVGAAELGVLLGRGQRSGIGLNLFERGGLIVDAGRGPRTTVPPVVSRLAFPDGWRVLLVFDLAHSGLNGRAESAAFDALPALPAASAAHLCHLTLMAVLPAVVERDFEAFSRAIAEIQAIIGDHFAAVQAGRYTSERVHAAIRYLGEHCALEGVGQSSWGPTAFAFVDGAARAETILSGLRARFAADRDLRFEVCAARNEGAHVAPLTQAIARRYAAV